MLYKTGEMCQNSFLWNTDTKSNEKAQREAGSHNIKFKFFGICAGVELIYLSTTCYVSKVKREKEHSQLFSYDI